MARDIVSYYVCLHGSVVAGAERCSSRRRRARRNVRPVNRVARDDRGTQAVEGDGGEA